MRVLKRREKWTINLNSGKKTNLVFLGEEELVGNQVKTMPIKQIECVLNY